MIRVMATGAAGRMGQAVVGAVNAAHDMDLVAMADPVLEADGVTSFTSVADAIAATSPEVAVDFTQPHVAFETVRTCLEGGVHAVVGTTGLTDDQMAELTRLADAGCSHAVVELPSGMTASSAEIAAAPSSARGGLVDVVRFT